LTSLTHTIISSSSAPPSALYSFPTRRSSDLQENGVAFAFSRGVDDALRGQVENRYQGLELDAGRLGGFADLGEISLRDRRNRQGDRKSTRLNSSHVSISYAVFCLKKKKE